MTQVFQNIGHVIMMLMLLTCSAFFSGSETAFFSLPRKHIKTLLQSKRKLQNLVGRLLSKPGQLLGALLLGNLIVNILFFATSSVLITRIQQQVSVTAAAIVAFVAFVTLVLFGEILPKSLSYANSESISVISAMPAFFLVRLLTPIVSGFRVLIVEPALRLLLGPAKQPKPVTIDEFKSLLEANRKRGLITHHQNKLFAEVIELGFLKVRHVMRPRVDIIACNIDDSAETAHEIMARERLTKLPVYAGSIDNVIGLIELRELILRPSTRLSEILKQVHFVPEQKTVESLIEFFRKNHIDTAIVVDEYGGIAGSVCLEDIAEELFGPIHMTEGIEPIEQIGPFQYRLAGSLTIHDWTQRFGLSPMISQISTIGGLVTALLGRIPQSGDIVCLKNLKFTVEQMRKRRVETIILTVEPIQTNAK